MDIMISGSNGVPRPTQVRSFSISDPVWWSACIAALIVGDVARRLLASDQSGLLFYVLGVPLITLLVAVPYWRWRLRASWATALTAGIGGAAITLSIGWLKGRSL
jgi:hypothetical protein